jgi:hypothetical protein
MLLIYVIPVQNDDWYTYLQVWIWFESFTDSGSSAYNSFFINRK